MIAERVQQSKLAALGRLSASIAHEIRNPVGAMSHAAQLLKESASLSPQDLRLTEIIHSNGSRVSSIVENVLQLSRRDSTRQERIDSGPGSKEFLAEFRQTLQLDDAEVRFAPADEDLDVRVDPSHLHQLSVEPVRKRLQIRPRARRTCLDRHPIGRSIANQRPYLEVADRALASIPPRPNRYSSLSLRRDRVAPGLASSLPANSHSATAPYFYTSSGKAVVVFSASSLRIRSAGKFREQNYKMGSPRALIVDDEPDIRELLGITLERMNIEVVAVADLNTARSSVRAGHFDLCLTDMKLPDGDGLSLVEWVQTNRPQLPIAVITAHGQCGIGGAGTKTRCLRLHLQAARPRRAAQADRRDSQADRVDGRLDPSAGIRLLGQSPP